MISPSWLAASPDFSHRSSEIVGAGATSANLCVAFLREIPGPNFSWPLHIPCPSVVCFPWFPCTDCNKRGGCSKPLGAGGVLAQKSVISACPPPCSAAVLCTPWYRGQLCGLSSDLVWDPLSAQPCTCGCGWHLGLLGRCWVSSDISEAVKKVLGNPRETLTGFWCFV